MTLCRGGRASYRDGLGFAKARHVVVFHRAPSRDRFISRPGARPHNGVCMTP